MHEFDEGQPMAQLATQVDQLGRLVAQLKGQLRGHQLVAAHRGGLDPVDLLETLRAAHMAIEVAETLQVNAVVACRSLPAETRPSWTTIGAAVGQARTNAHRSFSNHVAKVLDSSGGDATQ